MLAPDANTWADDGHDYDAILDGCTKCGIQWIAYLDGPVPCLAPLDWPPSVWPHGICGACGIEICPPLDGDGAIECVKCAREYDRMLGALSD